MSSTGGNAMRPIVRRICPAARRLALVALLVATGGSAAYLANRARGHPSAAPSVEPAKTDKVQRFGRDGVSVPLDMARNMGIQTAVTSGTARALQLPALQGCLALDNNRLARVHSRFAGEVVGVGTTADGADEADSPGGQRPLRTGDRVRKGDLLAVVWSKELGEKKSELVDAVSKLRADDVTLRRLRDAYTTASVPERSVRDAERAVEADQIAVDRVQRTLRSWRLTNEEIADVRAEADKLTAPTAGPPDPAKWARVEVRSPQDGVVLEKNVAPGDIVDTTTDLFKVGDLSHLVVWAHVYEEDLPLIQALPRPVRWAVGVSSRPGSTFPGTMEQVGAVIDPNQHTALVTGRVENPTGDLKVGQFVTVTVTLPPPAGQLELPADAVVEDGRESVVFVQPNADETRFVRTPIQVARRFRDGVCVRTGGPLRAGDRVVTSGALLLRDAMDELPAPQQ